MNCGKIFENDFKKSVPKDVYCLRLTDSAIGFDVNNSTQRFALKSPYDFVLCKDGRMYAIELKSNAGTSISFDGEKPEIKPSQIKNLLKAECSGAVAGLLLNFRKTNETFFIPVGIFKRFVDTCSKKSININDAKSIGIEIPARKLKVHYRYNLSEILSN